MYEYTLTFKEPVDKEIKKGDKFICTSDVTLEEDNRVILYKTGCIYNSEIDDCITDELGNKGRYWIYEEWDENWTDYFQRYEEKPDKDYFQSIQEEYSCSCNVGHEGECKSSRRQFDSGAVRDSNEGKSRPDLISPYFTERLGFRLAEGAKKYEANNWKKGIPDEAFLESLERHLVAYKMGKTDEDHAAAIAFNVMGIIHNEEVRKLNK